MLTSPLDEWTAKRSGRMFSSPSIFVGGLNHETDGRARERAFLLLSERCGKEQSIEGEICLSLG